MSGRSVVLACCLGALLAVPVLAAETGGPGSAEGGEGRAEPTSGPAAQTDDGSPAGATSRAASRRERVGRSVQDRPIEVRRLGRLVGSTKVLVVGSIHGDETEGHRIVRRLRGHHRPPGGDVDLWTVATVNPDGVAARSRGNARGVDLNRNFPYRFDPSLTGGYYPGPRPLAEPESRAVARISRRARFDLAIWYHQPWGVTLVPCDGARRAARRYARLSGLAGRHSCGSQFPGAAARWQHARFQTSAFVVELPGRRLRAREVARHARAVARLGREIDARRNR